MNSLDPGHSLNLVFQRLF